LNYTYTNPLSITSQFSFCGLPFRLDTYAGCAVGCRYCFARIRGGNIQSKKIKIANPEVIIKRFENGLKNENSGIISEFIKKRVPVHFGGMSDPFQSLESKYKVTYKVLKYLKSIDYPVIISTKSDLIGEEKYQELFKGFKSLVIQISLSTLDSVKSKILEPNSPEPSILLECIKNLSANNINVTLRWQPYILDVSEEIGYFVDRVKDTGLKHIGFEHLKLPVEKNHDIEDKYFQITDNSIYKLYKEKGAVLSGREFVLPVDVKIKNIKKLIESLKNTSISIGFGDNEFQYLSTYSCCCSGVDMFDGFENWYKPQISHAIRKAYLNNDEEIKISGIENEWNSNGSIDKFVNSKSRISKKDLPNTMYDYVLNRWNDLDSLFNPTQYYNVEFADKLDSNGNKIYRFGNQNV
jgi:DNA repair photolyase